jgi:hypothetical protein
MTDLERAEAVELAFRQVNDQIRALSGELFRQDGDEDIEIVCECAAAGCCERIAIAAAEYDRIRKQSRCFVILPGHEQASVEGVAERSEGYVVVRKISSQRAADIGATLDSDPQDGGRVTDATS